MRIGSHPSRGYTILEMIVVLVIIGILATVGVSMTGSRQGPAVRSLMDEVEGAIEAARNSASAQGRDVALVSWGSWDKTDPRVLAFGANDLPATTIQDTAKGLLNNVLPASTLAFGATVAVGFHYLPADAIQSRARFVTSGSADWATTLGATPSGTQNQALSGVDPFKAGGAMEGILTNANNLIGSSLTQRIVSGSSKRFNETFFIQIIGTSPNGGCIPGSPMGLIVVLGNGSGIYKFYNPGVREGNGLWRRI